MMSLKYHIGLVYWCALKEALCTLCSDWSISHSRFVKQDQVVIARLQTAGVICLETFKEFPQMARFTLRDEGECLTHKYMYGFFVKHHSKVVLIAVYEIPAWAIYWCTEARLFNNICHPRNSLTLQLLSPSSTAGKTVAIGKVLKLVE